MKHTTRNVLAAAAIGVALAGCFRLPSSTGSGGGPDDAGRPTVPNQPAPPGASRPGQSGQAGGSLEGRFSYRTMNEYVDAVMPLITEWSAATWRSMPLPQQVVYVRHGTQGPEACLDETGARALYSSASYEYCGADEVIYVGQDTLWEFYTKTGDAGPAVGLAHEFGHHVQEQVGVPDPQTAAQSVRHEDQADCIAGAWVKYMDDTGRLEYPDDLQDIDALFPLIGSAEGPGRDHGTAGERLDAFVVGFKNGVSGCNDFYPATPLISS